MSDNKYRDLVGQDINVDDYVVYSTSEGRSAVMKMGRVVELGQRKEARFNWRTKEEERDPVIKVVSIDPWRAELEWSWRNALQNGGRPVTLAMFDRVLVVSKLPALIERFEQLKARELPKVVAAEAEKRARRAGAR